MANYGVINPPSRPPRGMHLPTPARLGGRKSGLRRNPGPEGRCAKTQSVKVGALQYAEELYDDAALPPPIFQRPTCTNVDFVKTLILAQCSVLGRLVWVLQRFTLDM